MAGNHLEIPTVPDPTPHTLRRMVRQEKEKMQNAIIVVRPVIGRGIARILRCAIDVARPDTNLTNAPCHLPQVERVRQKGAKEKGGQRQSACASPARGGVNEHRLRWTYTRSF